MVFPAHDPICMLDPLCWALGAVWMGKEDEVTEVLGSSWKAVPSPLATVHLQAIVDITVAMVTRSQIVWISTSGGCFLSQIMVPY